MKNHQFNKASLFAELKHHLPCQAALKDFVHHNPLHALQHKEFFGAIFSANKIFGIKSTFNIDEYRRLHEAGRIKASTLEQVLVREKGEAEVAVWREKMLKAEYRYTYNPRIGRLRAAWKPQLKFSLEDRVQPLLFRIICSYLDQGIALWHFPFEDQGLIAAIRTIEKNSVASFFGSRRAKALLADPELSLEGLLKIVVGREELFENYLLDQQFSHKGWSGMVSTIEDQPTTLFYSKSIQLEDFMILELLLEIDAIDQQFGEDWLPLGSDESLSNGDYFADIPMTEMDVILSLWHMAFEWDYYDSVLAGVRYINHLERKPHEHGKSFQAVFCVDDRECSIRRYMEEVDPSCETFGAPGFFGVSMYFQPFGGKFFEKSCPVPITPRHLIKELDAREGKNAVPIHDKRSHTFFRGLWSSFSLGLLSGGAMALDLFRPSSRSDLADSFGHMNSNSRLLVESADPAVIEEGVQVGFSILEMADIVEGLLKGIGLTGHFSDLIYIIAHGSSTANNTHHSAYECGACCGRPGSPNARAFATMGNHPEVRRILVERGLEIPESSRFVAAMHDTSRDVIYYYDLNNQPSSTQERHDHYLVHIEEALDRNAKERARRFASISMDQDIKKIRKAIGNRSRSYFEPRPELGHGSNALCFIGARQSLKGLFLDRRAFLQSYDYRQDPKGETLAKVLGPLPGVCGGINLEYYFSRMDNQKMGAGTKLPHNVVGLFGVANSSDGDLRTGLALQMIEAHDPIRLMMIVEHDPEIILAILEKSPANREWFNKGWIHLVASSPRDRELYLYRDGEFQKYSPQTTVTKIQDTKELINRHPEMKSNHILDATRENLPVHVYGSESS